MSRRPLIVGNWKMNKTAIQTAEFIRELRTRPLPDNVDVVIAPPFTALAAAAECVRGSSLLLAAQNMHEAGDGPFTGEISADMLREFDVRYVLLGHSERRANFCETDAALARKIPAALAAGIVPIAIVGESLEDRRAGRTVRRVVGQLQTMLGATKAADVARCAVAYEPIWAIGSGLVDDPAESDAVMGALRECAPGLADVRILYGGSMKPANAAALMAQPNIDGGLVGGASLDVAAFAAIVEAAAQRAIAA